MPALQIQKQQLQKNQGKIYDLCCYGKTTYVKDDSAQATQVSQTNWIWMSADLRLNHRDSVVFIEYSFLLPYKESKHNIAARAWGLRRSFG